MFIRPDVLAEADQRHMQRAGADHGFNVGRVAVVLSRLSVSHWRCEWRRRGGGAGGRSEVHAVLSREGEPVVCLQEPRRKNPTAVVRGAIRRGTGGFLRGKRKTYQHRKMQKRAI